MAQSHWAGFRWVRYLQGLLLAVAATLLGLPIRGLIEPTNLVMLFLVTVVVAALYLGRGPSLMVSVLGALSFDYFFVDPRLSMDIHDTQYLLTLFGLLVVSLVVSDLAGRVRDQVEVLRLREAQTTALYNLGRELTVALDLDAIFQTIIRHISQVLSRDIVILMPAGSRLELKAGSPEFQLDESELAVATWAFENERPAGRATRDTPRSKARYLPLLATGGPIGVLGVKPSARDSYLTTDQLRLLDGFANLSALAIERAHLAEQAGQAQVLRATERLQAALLNSISHDLRTPLASITGVLSSLRESEKAGEDPSVFDPSTRSEMVETAFEEAGRLNRLVGNLLDMSRMEAGALKMHREPCDVQDLTGASLAQMGERMQDRPVQIDIPADLPMVTADFVLINQVMINLLDNAVKYSPPGSRIDIQAQPGADQVTINIADRGIGVPPEDLQHIFDKFYRVRRPDGVIGTGLGLSICKGIVEAHGGQIWAKNRPGGGTVIGFTLPSNQEESGYEQ